MKTKIVLLGWMLASGFAGTAMAQTRVDLRTQSKSVDFSAALSTKPIRTGTGLPVTCSVAELFFVTSASPGLNVYLCTGANVWTLEGSVAPPANYSSRLPGRLDNADPQPRHNEYRHAMLQRRERSDSYASLTVNNVNQATATFSTSQTGRCVVNGYGGPGISRYATSFIAQTSVSIPAAAHIWAPAI